MATGHGGARSGAGRPTGKRNKLTEKAKATLTELATAYTGDALATLASIMKDETAPPSARVAAANSLLDRGHGKPVQAIAGADDDGAPVLSVVIERRAAKGAIRVTRPE
jgi:hypothetical protein